MSDLDNVDDPYARAVLRNHAKRIAELGRLLDAIKNDIAWLQRRARPTTNTEGDSR